MARSRTQACAGGTGGVCVVLIAMLLAAPARAEEAAPTPAPLSQVCQAGNAEVATQHPLPNVAAALRDRKPLRILAIGAAGGRRGARGSYTALSRSCSSRRTRGLTS